MAHAMFSGSTDKDCYSDVAAYTTGSYYDIMKESVFLCLGHIDAKSCNALNLLVYLDDLPTNDFNLLYSKLEDVRSRSNVLGENTYFATIGKTMYSQCLAAESVDIVFSSAALHWLSKTPCDIKDGLTPIHADVHEQEMFRQQASEDWKTFLLSRGRELKTGGYMVLTITVCQEGDASQNSMVYTSDVWRKMFFQGKISRDEFVRTTSRLYVQRSDEDIRLPFTDPDIHSLGLRLVSLESRKHDHIPLLRLHSEGRNAYAAAVAAAARPILRNVIYYGFAEDRTTDEKNKLVQDYFTMLTDAVFEGSETFDFFTMKEVVVTKE